MVVRDVIVSRDGEDDVHVTATIFSQEFTIHDTERSQCVF